MKIKPSDIKKNRRLCSEFYSRNISQKVSHYFSALFIRLDISPNFIYLDGPAPDDVIGDINGLSFNSKI